MPWTSLQGKKPTARHLFRNSPIEKNDFSYYFLLLLLLASKNLSALTRSPLLSAGVGGYMVTFTINIPPMLAYIYIPAPWILWVISHQLLMKIAIFPAWIADHQWLSLFLLQRIKIFSQFSMQFSVVLCGFICYFPWKKRHDDPTRFAAQNAGWCTSPEQTLYHAPDERSDLQHAGQLVCVWRKSPIDGVFFASRIKPWHGYQVVLLNLVL